MYHKLKLEIVFFKLNSCRSDPEAIKEVTFDDITSEVIYSFVPEDDSAKSLYWSLPTNFLGNKVRNQQQQNMHGLRDFSFFRSIHTMVI